MTCIVAQKTKTGIVMGAESGTVENGLMHRKADPKVWNATDRIVVGVSGHRRLVNAFREFDYGLIARAIEGVSPERIPHLIGKELRPAIDPHTTEKRYGFCLLAIGKDIFRVDFEVGVLRLHCPYSALGAGEEVAIGALYVLNREYQQFGLPTEERAKEWVTTALDAACEHVTAQCPPYSFAMTVAS
jgi:20S proteasome alpha/beta subunit